MTDEGSQPGTTVEDGRANPAVGSDWKTLASKVAVFLVGGALTAISWGVGRYAAFLLSAPHRLARFGEAPTEESATAAWELRTAGVWLLVLWLGMVALGAVLVASWSRCRVGDSRSPARSVSRRVIVRAAALAGLMALGFLVGPCSAWTALSDDRLATIAAASWGPCGEAAEESPPEPAGSDLRGPAGRGAPRRLAGKDARIRRLVKQYQAMPHPRPTGSHAPPGPRSVVEAINAYHRARGEYPQSLRDLVPEFLPAIPPSPLLGYPFLDYRRLSHSASGVGFELLLEPPPSAAGRGPAVVCRLPVAAWAIGRRAEGWRVEHR
ncbi:MAG: hypothetical protein HY907_11170 [Deltaproteobacteria bacterium]|nr:hypothetical protein [Deltaproteobacteria bacterium]